MSIEITLTPAEVMMAAQVGLARRIDSVFKKYDHLKHATRSEWSFDIDGACAELAVAKAMGVYWSGHVGSFKEPDVGNIHVRSTTHLDGHLIIRDNDPEEYTYIFVVTNCPKYKIIGGISGKKAKQKEKTTKESSGVPAWWIEQKNLTDPQTIFKWIKVNSL